MEDNELKETLDVHTQSIRGPDGQPADAGGAGAGAAGRAGHRAAAPRRPPRPAAHLQGLHEDFKESTPQLSRHMEALEGGMLALLGQGTEP
ncbi:hypothetical protein HK414_11925 [Ramlibacter terrae]|uniref:Uncharacterized protein n=1 Tax=Ramlibacter terrae TaxID=2732511 RepID=A0ABX6P567_9BURK|nr:hypothetical protein HK414_11925 [Ramlibacter terrae]